MIKKVNSKLKLNNNKSNNHTVGASYHATQKAITIIALVITIIILLILSGVVLILVLRNDGILNKTEVATDEHIKQEASETMNLKITNIQIQSYGENKKLPSLQYLADKLCEDDEMEYVIKKEKEVASLEKIDVSDVTSIFTKIKKYPYEFEIDSSLRLSSIDGVKITQDNNSKLNILWENPNADTVNFNEQTIELASSEYDYLEILYKNVTVGGLYYVQKIYKGYSTELAHINSKDLSYCHRIIEYNDDTHLVVDNAYFMGQVDNSLCIPVKIIGFRF